MSRSGRPPCAPRRGAALLLAMLVLALVAMLATGMLWQQNRSLQLEAAERARAQSRWILSGALDWARLILREDLRGVAGANPRGVDSLDEPWATPLAEARLSTFLAVDAQNNVDSGPEAFLSGAIVDAQSRFNLRNLFDDAGRELPVEVAALERLCSFAALPPDTARRVVDGLRGSWAGPAAGAASGAVAAPVDPAQAALAPGRVADLAWIGLEPAVAERLASWVDVLPQRTPVNVNTAPREVLAAVLPGLDLGGAERLVQLRRRKPFENIDELKAQLGRELEDPARVAVGSGWFVVTGRLRLDERVLEERSLLRRGPGGGDANVVVVRRERLSLAAPQR